MVQASACAQSKAAKRLPIFDFEMRGSGGPVLGPILRDGSIAICTLPIELFFTLRMEAPLACLHGRAAYANCVRDMSISFVLLHSIYNC